MRYNGTSLAYKVEEYNELDEVVAKVKKTDKKKNKISKLFLFVCFIYSISIIASLLVKTAYITEQKTKLTAIKQEYGEILNENKKLEVSINSQIDLKKVEEFAIATLNMNKPKKSQIVYISTRPDDYGEVIEQNNENSLKKQGIITGIIKSIIGIFAYSN